MAKSLQRPEKGKTILEWAMGVTDLLNELARGPKVVSPLGTRDGAIFLGLDFNLYAAKTTAAIPARSGTTWGSGAAAMFVVDGSGKEQTVAGGSITVWNFTGGSIPSGTRVFYRLFCGIYAIVAADCSGVA